MSINEQLAQAKAALEKIATHEPGRNGGGYVDSYCEAAAYPEIKGIAAEALAALRAQPAPDEQTVRVAIDSGPGGVTCIINPDEPAAGQLATMLAQIKAVGEEVQRKPGQAIPVPPLVAEEGRKFMRGEPSLFDQIPIGAIEGVAATIAATVTPDLDAIETSESEARDLTPEQIAQLAK